MADNKKSILEQALLDAKRIQEALHANSKEILRSVAREEIDGLVKESLEEDYDEEDVDDMDVDVDTAGEAGEETETDMDLDIDSNEMDDSLEGDDLEGDYESGMDALASDELEMDMRDASDEDVIAVYKKLTGDDEIEVVVDDENGDLTLNVSEPGEFVIKNPQGNGEAEDFSVEPDMDLEPEMGGDDDYDVDLDMEDDTEDFDDEDSEELDMEDDTEEFGDEDEDEEVVYEIALDEDTVRTASGDINNTLSGDIAYGDIEGQSADIDSDSGDNLVGGFDDDAVPHANAEGPTVMSEDEDEISEEDEDEDTIEEKIQVGKGRNVTNNKTDIVGAGGKSNKVKSPNVTAVNETVKKYNALLTEAKELKARNGEYKEALKNFRTMLAETVVFNSNLTYVTKLFMEHSTTKSEKEAIFKRFDNEVSTLKESKKLFKTIGSELSSRKTLNESIGNKLNNEVTSSASNQLNESNAYVDKETSRIVDLMRRVSKR